VVQREQEMTEDIYKEIAELDKAIHERARLAIMTLLYHHREVNFNYLRQALQATEGNLATHLRTLEDADYIEVTKGFRGKRPETTYRISEKGRKEYKKYLQSLEKLLEKEREWPSDRIRD
jgi:DNA-binding MarR family transcriptional regulator